MKQDDIDRLDLCTMRLHEVIRLEDNHYEILSVIGGWVYTSYGPGGNLSSCFVPFTIPVYGPNGKASS